MNGELAIEPLRTEARAPGEFRTPSQPSSGSPAGPLVQFAVIPVARFPMKPQSIGQDYSAWIITQPSPSKEKNSSQIRFLADEKARQLSALGEDQSRLGNREHAVELLEKALRLAQSAAVFSSAIKTCIEIDSVDLARKWAAQGRALYPEDQSLTRWHRLLSPPAVRTVETSTMPRSEEVAWLIANAKQYRGKWVVVARSELLGFGKTLTEALQMARSRGSISAALIHRVRD